MRFEPLPQVAGWRHQGARDGFEVTFFRSDDAGQHVEGRSVAVEDGDAWAVEYSVEVDSGWHTRRALVAVRSVVGSRQVRLETDGRGSWLVDGAPAPHLEGCLDVDLEASVVTNALPVHRLRLAPGDEAQAPAAFVRTLDLAVERLEQHYVRLPDAAGARRYAYAAPRFGYMGELTYDASGLLLRYPRLATRAR